MINWKNKIKNYFKWNKKCTCWNELKKLQTFDPSLFIGQIYFNNDGAQLYLILQPLYYTFKRPGDTEKVVSWKCKCLSAEKLTTPITTDITLLRQLNGTKI